MSDTADPTLPFHLEPANAERAEVTSVKRSKTPIVLAGAVAVALVLGVGAFLGYRFVFGGAQPAERLPGSAIAYVSVDLTPGADQTRKLLDLARKFPGHGEDRDAKASLEKLFEDLDIEGVDPKRDINSWLGMRLAVGAWQHSDEPYAVLAVASTNDEAAKKGLATIREKARTGMGFVVRDGYALIAIGEKNGQAAADAAEAEAVKSPLSKSAKFADARKWLADDQILVVYADLDGLGKLIKTAMREMFTDEFLEVGEGFDKELKSFKGTVIAGARIEDNAVLVRGRSFGAEPAKAATISDAIAKLGALPAGSEIAAVATIPEDANMSSLAFGLPFAFGSSRSVPGSQPLTKAEQKEFDDLIAKDFANKLTTAERKRLDELEAKLGGGPGPKLTPAQEKELDALFAKEKLTPAEQMRLEELLGGPAGGSFSGWDDLMDALAGATVSVSATGLDGKPAFRAIAALAKVPSEQTVTELAKLSGDDVKVTVEGTTLTVESPRYSTSGKLSDNPLFQKATAGAPANIQVAAFIDLTKAMPAKRSEKRQPFQALCFMTAKEGNDQVVFARILIG